MANQNPILLILTGLTTDPNEQYLNYNVSAHTNPSFISAVENPIIFTLKSSGVTTSTVAYLQFTISNSFLPADGNYFIISGDSASDYPSYQFTAAAEPKVNEYYSSGTTPSKNAYEIADSIVYTMNENVSFRQRFYAIIQQTDLSTYARIRVYAISPGSRYNMNFYDSAGIFSSVFNLDVTDGNRGQTLKDYTVFADVYVNSLWGGSDVVDRTYSEKVSSIEITYNPDNEYIYDVSNIMKNYVSTSLPSITTGITRTIDNLNNVYLVFGEKYDEFDNGYRRRFIVGQSDIAMVYNGSLDKLQYNSLSAYTVHATTLSSVTQNAMSYLTNSPNGLYTFPSQKQFLSFIWYNKSTAFLTNTWQLRGTYQKVDGSYSAFTSFTQAQTEYGVLTVNTTMDELGIPTTGVLNYTIALYLWMDSGHIAYPATDYERVTAFKKYNVLQECQYDYSKEIHWLNPLGGWDSWVFNGEIEEKTKRKSEEFSISTPQVPTSTDAIDSVIDLEIERQITINSGWVDKEHFDWLFDIAKSKDVRLYEDDIHKAIVITDIEQKLDTSDDLYSLSITYKLARPENTLDK